MPIAPDLLEILACPENRTPLAMLDAAALSELNSQIADGAVKNCAGQPVREKLSEALVREDQMIVYPIRSGIPVLLVEEGIPLPANP